MNALYFYGGIALFFAIMLYFLNRSEKKGSDYGTENYQRRSYDHMEDGIHR